MTATHTRELCIMACVFCKEHQFQKWISELAGDGQPTWENQAKAFILSICQITSRNDLDRDPEAAERFHELVRKPFLAWKSGDKFPESEFDTVRGDA